MYKILHYISKINTFFLILCILYFAIKGSLGNIISIFIANNIVFEIIYIILALVVIFKFIHISSPYSKYLNNKTNS